MVYLQFLFDSSVYHLVSRCATTYCACSVRYIELLRFDIVSEHRDMGSFCSIPEVSYGLLEVRLRITLRIDRNLVLPDFGSPGYLL